MAAQKFVLQFVNDPQYYMAGSTPGGKRWCMSDNEMDAKQFTYLQAVRYCAKYPGRFNIEPSLYGIA